MFTPPRYLLSALAMTALMFNSTASYAALVDLDFSTADQLTDNFNQTSNPHLINWNSANGPDGQPGIVRFSPSGSTATMRYDGGPANFLTESVSFDVRSNTYRTSQTPSIALITRVQEDTGLGIGLFVFFRATGEVRLQIRQADSNSSSVGSTLWEADFNLTDGTVTNNVGTGGTGSTNMMSVSGWMHVDVLQYNDIDGNAVVGLTLSNANGLIASTDEFTWTGSSAFTNPGTVGFRVGVASGGDTALVDIDNFRIIPEPASLVLLAAGGLMALSRRRRA